MNGQGAAQNWNAMDMRAPAAQQFSNVTTASHQPVRSGPLVNGAPVRQLAGNVSDRPRPVTNVHGVVDWPSIATGASNQNAQTNTFQRPHEPPRNPQVPVTSREAPRPAHHAPRAAAPPRTMSAGTSAKCREMWCRLQVVLDGKPIVAQDELLKFSSELVRFRQDNSQQVASKDEEIARLTEELQKKESENQFCRERLNNEIKSLHDRMQEKEDALDDLEEIAVDIKNLQDENVQLREQVEELTDEATALDSTWKAKLDAADAEKAKLKNKLKSKEKQLQLELSEHGQSEQNMTEKMGEMKSRLSFLKFQTIVLRSDKKKKREEFAKLKTSLTLAEEKYGESTRNSEKLADELLEEKKLCKKAMEDQAYSQKLADELRNQLKERIAAKPTSKEPNPDRIKELEVKNKKLKLRIAYFETKLGEMNVLKNKLREKDSRLGHMEKDAGDTERRLRRKCSESEKECQSLRAENQKLKSGAETKTSSAQTTLDLDKLESQVNSEKQQVQNLKKSLEDSQNQVKLWREQLGSLECRIFEIEKDNAPLRMEVAKHKSRIAELEPMEERAKKLEDDKKRLIEQIKSHENGVLCLTKETHSAKRERQVMEDRLSDVRDKYERQLSATKETYQRQLSENVNLHKTINENLKEIDRLRSTVTTVRKTVSAVVKERDELQDKVKAVSDAKTAIFKKQSEDALKLDELNESLKAIVTEGEKWKKMTDTLREENQIMTAANSGLSEQLGKSQVEVEKITKDRTNWKNMADLLTKEKQNIIKTHHEDIDNLKKDIEEANKLTKELNSRLLALSIEKSALDKRLENEKKDQIDLKTVKEQEKTIQDLKKKISQLEDDKNDIKRTKAKLSDELSDMSGIRDSAVRNVNRLEKELEEKKATIRSMSGRIRDMERDRSRERDSRRVDRERRHGHSDRDLRDVLEQPPLLDDPWNGPNNNNMNMRNISPIFFDGHGPPMQLSPMPFDSAPPFFDNGPRLRDIDIVFNSNRSPDMPFDGPRDMGPRGMDPRDMDPRDMDPRDLDPRDLDPRDMDPRDCPRDDGPSWRGSRRPRRGRERRGLGKGLKCRSCPGYFPNKFKLKNHHCDDFR